ncbi:MAG: class I SAM-dependent methyltransferase [Psychroserpens sp.]|uniref:class I SAM-dependent methyltransferase n=1 Tax=Psychroserpens sp. TaxID=2020870 RepID=UPI003C87F52E
MDQVYANKLWGDDGSQFYSGDGSHYPEITDPYIAAVTDFLKSFEDPLVVVDLGCGDFNVGRDLVKYSKKYIAVDIVNELIDHNRENFKSNQLEFQCLDIAVDQLPSGDCAILRQVLQHLSNAEIQNIIPKLADYKYVILTEHLPDGDFLPNKDIISGQGIRLKKHSGVDVTAKPFLMKVKSKQVLCSVKPRDYDGVILTTLYFNEIKNPL